MATVSGICKRRQFSSGTGNKHESILSIDLLGTLDTYRIMLREVSGILAVHYDSARWQKISTVRYVVTLTEIIPYVRRCIQADFVKNLYLLIFYSSNYRFCSVRKKYPDNIAPYLFTYFSDHREESEMGWDIRDAFLLLNALREARSHRKLLRVYHSGTWALASDRYCDPNVHIRCTTCFRNARGLSRHSRISHPTCNKKQGRRGRARKVDSCKRNLGRFDIENSNTCWEPIYPKRGRKEPGRNATWEDIASSSSLAKEEQTGIESNGFNSPFVLAGRGIVPTMESWSNNRCT